MNKKNKSTRLDEQNLFFEDKRGLNAERRDGRQKRQSVIRGIKLPGFDYTRRMKRLGARRGTTVLYVDGRHGVRVLGALSKLCSVKNVAITEDGVQFEVPSKLRSQIIALLDNLCYNYKIIRVKGAFPFAFNAAARLGFAVGAIVVSAAIAIFSQLVTRVSVSAVDPYSGTIDGALNASISGILNSHGVSVGSWLPSLDLGDVEKSILALDGVSYASVKRHGTHVAVEIRREQPPAELAEVSGSRVVSKKVAVVTRVIVEGGTAVVDYGDVVRAGDTLIDGYVVFGEDKLEVEAKGAVYGKVYYKRSVFFADTERVREVGRVKRVTKIAMFGKVPKPPESPFEKYEVETSVSDLGFFLPVNFYTYEFREIVEREYKNTLSEDEMKKRVYSETVAGLNEPAKVLESYCTVTRADGGSYVTVTVEAEERIS